MADAHTEDVPEGVEEWAGDGPALIRPGGEGGIRTHGTLARTTVFETVPIDHSGTSPEAVAVGI